MDPTDDPAVARAQEWARTWCQERGIRDLAADVQALLESPTLHQGAATQAAITGRAIAAAVLDRPAPLVAMFREVTAELDDRPPTSPGELVPLFVHTLVRATRRKIRTIVVVTEDGERTTRDAWELLRSVREWVRAPTGDDAAGGTATRPPHGARDG